ncbi:DUF808 family protein [Roseomonas sp. GCM10028921]
MSGWRSRSARNAETPPTCVGRALATFTKAIGRGLVRGMPHFPRVLGIVGTAAMVWVGAGNILHGLEEFGVTAPGCLVHAAGHGGAAANS